MALVTIFREHHRWDDGLAYTAVLDGDEAGELHDAADLSLVVSSGEHRLHFVAEGYRSHSLIFRVHENADVRLLCSAAAAGPRVLLIPYYVLRRGE